MMRIVGCFLEYDGQFVILLRNHGKRDADRWGLPAGKIEPDETAHQAAARELREETGYCTTGRDHLELLTTMQSTTSDGLPYEFTCYQLKLKQPHKVLLETSAHRQFRWVTAADCLALPNLINDLDQLLEIVGKVPAGSAARRRLAA